MIKYKHIEHERTEDALFIGALIVAPSCKFKCKGCFNRPLKAKPNKLGYAESIIEEVLSNKFNEGIILAGLEWSESPMEMLKLIDEAVKYKLKIAIYTGCELTQFYSRIGEAVAKSTGQYDKMMEEIKTDEDYIVFVQIGQQVLDYKIPYEYTIKVGKYDETQLVDDNVQFGIKLASANQKIYVIKGEK